MKLRLIVLSLTLVLVTGCGAVGSSESPSVAVPAPAATAQSRCGGSLEGCFSFREMSDYLDAIKPLVARFFSEQYPKLPAPRIVYVADGRAVAGCGAYANGQSFEYCPINETIYIGQDLLWAFYRQAGDAAPALGLAHEWGHHLQFMLDVPAPRTAAESVRFENQADCISGAWLRYANQQGWLEEADDVGDVDKLLAAIGSREGRARDHGTAAERLGAFQMSYKAGIKACDSFFPASPLG